MYLDGIKGFAKSEKELGTLIQRITIYTQVFRMEFGIEKFVMLIMKSEKKTNNGRNIISKSRKI